MKTIFGGTETKMVRYVEELFQPEDPVLKEVRENSERNGLPLIQVGRMDGLHLEVLTRISGAKKAVEIGTLGGYSGICIARGLGPTGKLHTFELEPAHAATARDNFNKAGVSDQVEIHIGPALENLGKIVEQGPFDLVFIDADKESYPAYLQWATQNLRVGGMVVGDNTFGWGMIADSQFESVDDEKMIKGLQEFNRIVAQGGQYRSTILPTGEGLTVGVKMS